MSYLTLYWSQVIFLSDNGLYSEFEAQAWISDKESKESQRDSQPGQN